MGHSRHHRRSGFTLIELLSVIAIIALMASLLIGASFRFVASARETATATTIMKASGIIQDRVRAFQEAKVTDGAYAFADQWNTAFPQDLITVQLAEVLVRKVRYRKAFPQAFNDLDNSQISRFFPSLAGSLPSAVTGYDSTYEPGIVLYAMIKYGDTFGTSTPSDDTFGSAELRNGPETGGVPCLVDAWGQPLRFYRWPTRLIRCGEWNFSGSTSNTFDDYNQNGSQDPPGWVEPTGSATSGTLSPAIRPCPALPSPTPASLLMSNLPPYNVVANAQDMVVHPANYSVIQLYVLGTDGQFGSSTGFPPMPYGTLGCPDTDDPEPLNTDPDDPTLKLQNWLFDQVPVANPTATLGSIVFFLGDATGASSPSARRQQFIFDFHDFYTFQTPLIVSAGPDRILGLYEPTDRSANCGYLAAPAPPRGASGYALPAQPTDATGPALLRDLIDNITNLNQRSGGSR